MHLDYLSCALTVVSTLLVGRRNWTGLVVAAVNSLIVCDIGWKTSQIGLIPANVFCLGVYAFSVRSWIRGGRSNQSAAESENQEAQAPLFHRILAKARGAASQTGDKAQTEAKPQPVAAQNELQQPAQSKAPVVTVSRAWMQHSPRRRQVRPATAWPRSHVYSRAAAR
jgi:hypothetical protein